MSIIFDYADIAERMKGELAPRPKDIEPEPDCGLSEDFPSIPGWVVGDPISDNDPPPPPSKPQPTPITRQIF